jgi:hypothetical protein
MTMHVRLLVLLAIVVEACVSRPSTLDATGSGSASDGGASDTADGTGGPIDCSNEPQAPWDYELPEVGEECTPFHNELEFVPYRVRITNGGTEPIHLVGPVDCVPEHIEISDADGRWWAGDKCTPVCDGGMLGECSCLLDCPSAGVVTLMPGGTFQALWPGLLWEDVQMPDTCATADCAGLVDCRRAITPTTTSLNVEVAHITSLECDGASECPCVPNEEGWCNPSVPLPEPETVVRTQSSFDFPLDCPTVELMLP